MDFYVMKRKKLQSLCKTHGIPANLANAEMANRLTLLLKKDGNSMTEVEPVYKNLKEIESEIDSKAEGKKVKKVKFSPENETFHFVGTDKDSDSDCDYVAKKKRVAKRKSIVNRVSKKKQVQVIENAREVELSTKIMDTPVRHTRSRAQKMAEGDAEAVFLPLPEKKKVRGGANYIDVRDKPPPEFELSERVGGNAEHTKLSGGLIQRQLRSRVVESEDGGDSLVLRKNVLPRGLKKSKDNKGSDGVLLANETCEDRITAGKGAKPEKIQKVCKGDVTKAEDSSVLTEKLGKINLCGRITRSRAQIEKKSSGIECEIGINKVQDECEEVLQLEETFKGLDRKSLRQKSAAPLKRSVNDQNLAGEGVEPGKTLRKSKQNLARDRDSECGQLAETEVRRSKKSETKIVGKACTTSYVGQEECEDVPQFEEPSKDLTINTSRQKYPVLQKGKEQAKVDTRKRPRNTDLERASKVELSVEILEENDILLPNGPLRRSRRKTTLFTSTGPDDSKLTISEASGTVKKSTESVAKKGSNVTKCPRLSSRNSCKKILMEATDDMGGIANGVKKGGIMKEIQESKLENESFLIVHEPLNKKPQRKSSRNASKSDLVAPTEPIGIAAGMNKKSESRMPIIAEEVLFTKINAPLEEEPIIDVGLDVLEAAGNDNDIESCCSREVLEKSSKRRKGSSKKTEPAAKGQPVYFAVSADMEKAMDVPVHLKENQLTESVKILGISTVQKAQNVTEPVNVMKSVMVDDGILDNTSVGHMDDHSFQSLNRGDTGHDHVVEQNWVESPDKLSNVASSRFTCLGDDHSPTYQPSYEGESFNLLDMNEGFETEASLPVKTTNQRTDAVDDQLADGSKASVPEDQNLVQLGASGINQPVLVKQNPEESPDKLSNADSSRFRSLPTYQPDCEGESSSLLGLNKGLETEASLAVKTINQRADMVDDQLADGSKASVPADQNLVQLDASGINQTVPVEPVLEDHLTELDDNKNSDRKTEKSSEVIEEISAVLVQVDLCSIKTAETVGDIHQGRIVPSDTAVNPSKSSLVKQEEGQLKDQFKSPSGRNFYEGFEALLDGSKNQNLSFDDVNILDENAVAETVKTCSNIESSTDAIAEKIESRSQKKSSGASNILVSLDSEVQERATNEVIQSALRLDQVKYGDPDIHEEVAIEMNRRTDMVGNANMDDTVGALDTAINSKNVSSKAEIEDNVAVMTEIKLDNIGDFLDHASEGNRVSQSEAGLASRDGKVDTQSIRDDFTEKLSAVNSFANPQMCSFGAIVDAEQDVAGKLDGPVEGNLKIKHNENAMDAADNTKIFEQCNQQFSEKKLSEHARNAELAEERIVEDNESFNEQDDASANFQGYTDCEKDRDACFGAKNSNVSTHEAMRTEAARIDDSDFAGLGYIAAEDMIFSGVKDKCGNTGVAEDKEARAMFGGCTEMQQPENRESLLPFGSVGLKRRDLPKQESEQFGMVETVSGMKVDKGLNAGKDGFCIDLGGYPEKRDLPSQEGNEIGVAETVSGVMVDEGINAGIDGFSEENCTRTSQWTEEVLFLHNLDDMAIFSDDSHETTGFENLLLISMVKSEMGVDFSTGSPVTASSDGGDPEKRDLPTQEVNEFGMPERVSSAKVDEALNAGIDGLGEENHPRISQQTEEVLDLHDLDDYSKESTDNRALNVGSEIFTQQEMNMILGDAEQDFPKNVAGPVEGNLKQKCSDNGMDDGENIKTFERCAQQFSEKQLSEHENDAESIEEPILEDNGRFNVQKDASAIMQGYKDREKDRDEYFGIKNSNVSTQKAMLTEASRIGDFGYTGLGYTTAENMNISGVEDKCRNTGIAEDKEAHGMTGDRMVMQQSESGDSFLEDMGEFQKSNVAAPGACTEVANGRSNEVSETLCQLDDVTFGGLGKCHEISSTLDKFAPGASVIGSMEAVIAIENVDDGTKLVGKMLLGLDGGCLWEERNSSDIKLVSDISCSRPDLGPSDLNVPLSCNDPERRDLTIQKGDEYGKGEIVSAMKVDGCLNSSTNGFGNVPERRDLTILKGNKNGKGEIVSPMKVDEGLNSGTHGFGGAPETIDFPMQEVKEYGVPESVSGMKVDEGLNAGIDDFDEENHTRTSKGTEEVHDMHNLHDVPVCSVDSNESIAFGNLHPNSMIKPEMRVDCSADSLVTASCHENKASELSVASPAFNSFEIKHFTDVKRDGVRKSDPKISKANLMSGDTEDVKKANESDVTPQVAAGQLCDHEHKMEEVMELNSNQEMGIHCHVGSPVSNFSNCGDAKRDGFEILDAGLIKASLTNENSEVVKEGIENTLGNGPVFAEQHCDHGHGNADEDIVESGDLEYSGVCTRIGKLIADAEMSGSNSSASDVPVAQSDSNHAKPQAGNNVNPDAEDIKFSVDSDIVSEVNARVDQCPTSANSVLREVNLESPRKTSWEANLDKGISVFATPRWKNNRNSLIPLPPKSLINTFDMKENFGITKSDQVNITAVKTSQNRRALEDLQNK